MQILSSFFSWTLIRFLVPIAAALTSFVALISYDHHDPCLNVATSSYPSNWLSYFGSYLADILYQALGQGALLVPIALFSFAVSTALYPVIRWFYAKLLLLILSLVFITTAFDIYHIPLLPGNKGGFIGHLGHVILLNLLTIFAKYQPLLDAVLFFFTMALGGVLFCVAANFKPYQMIIAVYGYVNKILNAIKDFFLRPVIFCRAIISKIGNILGIRARVKNHSAKFENGHNPDSFMDKDVTFSVKKSTKKTASDSGASKSGKENLAFGQANELPSLELLTNASNSNIKPQTRAELDTKAQELINVLNDFGVKGRIVDVKEGPVVTMYEFEPSAGTKSSRVIGLSDDIARSLCALSTRISVIPGRNALGIELPNKQRMFFRLKELMQTREFNDHSILLPLILGKDLSGMPMIADLAKMPHLLVAGTTGSGKSVAINAMIMSLLYRYTPQECRMIMIDPKMLELSAYDNIPHLLTPVVTEPSKAIVALKWAVKEMENRYRLMSHIGVRNISGYNQKIVDALEKGQVLERSVQTGFDPETGKPINETTPIEMVKMPFIVVIVDEMADLMLVAGKDIESSIQRLAQMARAAGIHIIMATQRPSVDVITGVIKANFPSRISFKVTSKIDSRTILGEQGSEQLLGMGDMLYMGNSSRILRVHGPFVEDEEVERVTNFLRTTGQPEYISAVTESSEDEGMMDNLSGGEVLGDKDLYKQAYNIVKTERKASISYIQRRLRIGYNRAASLVEELEANGVLSAANHSGKREVLLPEE